MPDTQPPSNTPKRDKDYGAANNMYYDQWKVTASYEIGVTQKIGGPKELEALHKMMVDQVKNPQILGFIDMPKTWIDPKAQAAGLEAIEDAFLQANLTPPATPKGTAKPKTR